MREFVLTRLMALFGAALGTALLLFVAVDLLSGRPDGDLLTVLARAAGTTLLLAVLGTLVSLFVGLPLGTALAVGYGQGSKVVPPVVMVVPALGIGMVASALGAAGNLTVILGTAIPGVAYTCVAARNAVAALWGKDFVTAALFAGLSPLSAAQRHVMPRLVPHLGVIALELMAAAVLVEVSLSFAGLGIVSPGSSLGLMLREGLRSLAERPLLFVAPGGVALMAMLALMLCAAGLKEGDSAAR